MALTFTGTVDRGAFVHAATLAHELVAGPDVARAWTHESSCAGMTVGGLARHLVDQSGYLVDYLGADPPGSVESIDVLEHYARSDWAQVGPEHEANLGIRDEWNELARTTGHEDTVRLHVQTLQRLPGVLATAPPSMYLPWQEVRMPTDDFLVTRMMEVVVHTDDLADSLGVATPDFGPSVVEPVVGLLAALAVVRHGQDAVVRAFTRPQRAPASVVVF